MVVAIRKEPNGSIYIDKNLNKKINYKQPPYNFTLIEIADEYVDCNSLDFNEDFSFNLDKYNARKEKEEQQKQLPQKLKRLEELRKDIVQDIAGLVIENIDIRKEEYRTLLNEVRVLQGKEPRNLKEI